MNVGQTPSLMNETKITLPKAKCLSGEMVAKREDGVMGRLEGERDE